ncbi:MAG: exosortase/archaeosortase family protein [Candidatus Omnitrophota bacterium]|nr:MAG: exosortase/archaeosortase family protein [Candidatus Omnitrophota bacterium]
MAKTISIAGQSLKISTFWKVILISCVFIVLFWPTYAPLFERFTAHSSYYSHGLLVPFISLYLVWRKRAKLTSLNPQPSSLGLYMLFAGICMHLFSTVLMINFGSYISIMMVIVGLTLYLGGKHFLRELLFPIGFLLFMMPLPEIMIIGIAFKMKIFVAHIATIFASAVGLGAVREGSTIYLPQGFLIIGDPCSGLRSLISFFALGILFTQFTKAHFIKKSLLVLFTIPIALLSNLIRIIILLFATHIYGKSAASGFFHDFSGVMVFVIGFIGFILVSRMLRCKITNDSI